MKKETNMKTYSLEELTDKYVGEPGSLVREEFDQELRLDILGQTIRKLREKQNMTQAELGELIGVKRAQISKIENSLTDARFETILKVFRALNTRINFTLEALENNVSAG